MVWLCVVFVVVRVVEKRGEEDGEVVVMRRKRLKGFEIVEQMINHRFPGHYAILLLAELPWPWYGEVIMRLE